MVQIAAQSPSWNGGSPTQYIQNTINANSAGTTYNLESGRHRFQTIQPKDGDTIVFESGAILTGGEDIGNTGWTQDSTEWYKGSITRGDTSTFGSSNCRTGYECGEMNCIVIDGEIKAWVTSRGSVDEHSAWYDSSNSRVYIGVNPSGKTIELTRKTRAIYGTADNVTITTDNASYYGIIEAYASDAQPTRAAVAPGCATSWPHTPTGQDWLIEHMIIRACAGAGYASGDGDTIRRCKVYNVGQLGMGSRSGSKDFVVDQVDSWNNGITGWKSGWEAGPNKWTSSVRPTIRNGRFQTGDNPHIANTSPFWFDINNDGYDVYDNIVADANDEAGRGIFLEIGWSGKVYNNMLWRLCYDSENDGWAKAIIFSNSGGITGSTEYDEIEVWGNVLYDCAGGIGGVIQDRGSGTYGTYNIYNINVHHNLTNLNLTGSPGWTPDTGLEDWDSTENIPTSGKDWDYNVYFGANNASTHFRNDIGGSGDSNQDWSDWQADGNDTNGRFEETLSHPFHEQDPNDGGCLAAAGGF